MTTEWLPNLITIFQILVLIFVVVRSARLIAGSKNPLIPVCFTFAMVSYLLSDLYWLAYDFLRPDTRMPFAANEMGECAGFLLLTAALSSILEENKTGTDMNGMPVNTHTALREMVFAAAFTVMNIVLWIAWSGEWLQDIIVGAALGYLLCILVRGLKRTGVFSKKDWLITGVASVLLIVMQVLTFFTHEGIHTALDIGCYTIMFAIVAFFLIRNITMIRKNGQITGGFCLALAGFCWVVVSMYMSSGVFYYILLITNSLMMLILLLAFTREVKSV